MIVKNVELCKLNRDELLRYLGYNNTPDDMVRGIIDKCEERLLKEINPSYIWQGFNFDCNTSGVEVLGTDLILEGEAIRTHLKECNKLVLICATLSMEADKLIRQCEIRDMAEALIMDTCGSVAIEQVLNIAEENIKDSFKDKYLTYRFGVGYGDLPLYHEGKILDILNAGKHIGLCASEANILTPRKSVVCILGVSDTPLPVGKKGCATCNMNKTCKYRKKGLSCSYT